MEKTIARELKVKLARMARRRHRGYAEASTCGLVSLLSMYSFEYQDILQAGIKLGLYSKNTWIMP
ncbi:MAG: hypothetical protein WC455_17860 [Dehalococcoidia bacterium]|jgi:hypothetical protein